MKLTYLAAGLAAVMLLGGCSGEQNAPEAKAFALTDSAVGYYCGMNLVEHDGPKGQIILASQADPVWFSSARDTVAFTMLPEEAKDITAIFVSDMGAAETWEQPGETNWIDAKSAFFVIGSSRVGGMGAAEPVPFAAEDKARAFAAEYGGEVVGFAGIPKDYVLGDGWGGAAAPAAADHSHQ